MVIKNVTAFTNDVIIAGIITGLTFLFGAADKSLITLLLVMCVDMISGILKGAKNQEVSSRKCFEGLLKKCFILIYIMLAHLLDDLLGCDYVRRMVCWLYIVNDIISIIENGAALGVPVPNPILKVLEVMNDEDTGNDIE